MRIMVGTRPTWVMRSAASVAKKSAASNLGAITKVPPRSKVSRATHRPKPKLRFSTSSVRSVGLKCSKLSICSNLPAKAAWLSTTPLGSPVEPEVKMMKAAPASKGRGGGARSVQHASSGLACGWGRSRPQRAPVRCCSAASKAAGVLRCTATTTPPASHTAKSAAMSPGWLDTCTSTGSSACKPASRSRAARAWAWLASAW